MTSSDETKRAYSYNRGVWHGVTHNSRQTDVGIPE